VVDSFRLLSDGYTCCRIFAAARKPTRNRYSAARQHICSATVSANACCAHFLKRCCPSDTTGVPSPLCASRRALPACPWHFMLLFMLRFVLRAAQPAPQTCAQTRKYTHTRHTAVLESSSSPRSHLWGRGTAASARRVVGTLSQRVPCAQGDMGSAGVWAIVQASRSSNVARMCLEDSGRRGLTRPGAATFRTILLITVSFKITAVN
jgi:hypothetical protein